MNPWLFWDLQLRTARMAAETLDASARVIRHRSGVISAAAHDPLTADYAELARMVSEKVLAFAQAGQSVAADWVALHQLWFGQMTGAMGHGTRSGAPSARFGEHASRSLIRAMTPIHSAATANDRRLKRRPKRR